MINHVQKVREKLHLLDILKEMDITSRFLEKIEKNSSKGEKNPLDFFFESLKIKMEVMNPDDEIVKVIGQCLE